MVKLKDISRISRNVITISRAAVESSNPFLVLDKQRFHFFRCNDRHATYIAGLPSQLTPKDILAINQTCDQAEGACNRRAKTVIAETLSNAFNRTAFRLTELGCGARPILEYFPRSQVEYHGVEVDPDHVEHIKSQLHLSASGWDGIPDIPAEKPSLCVSVYALHFMINRDLPQKINQLISADGAFIGNLYRDRQETIDNKQGAYLKRMLSCARMDFKIINDCPSNAYWVIGKPGTQDRIDDIAHTLQKNLQSHPLARQCQTSRAF